VCIALCTIVVHNIAQNRPDSFPPYPPDDHHSSDDVYLREGGSGSRAGAAGRGVGNGAGRGRHRNRFERRAEILPLPPAPLTCSGIYADIRDYCFLKNLTV